MFLWLQLQLKLAEAVCEYLSEQNKPRWGTREDVFPSFFPSVLFRISNMLLSDLIFVVI